MGVSMKGLDKQITEAMGAHGCWKQKLKEAVSRGYLRDPAEDIGREDLCNFGKWLKELSKVPEIASTSEFGAVVAAHARFHQAAGHVAKCVEKDLVDKASDLLDGQDFHRISAALGKAMIEWRKSLQ